MRYPVTKDFLFIITEKARAKEEGREKVSAKTRKKKKKILLRLDNARGRTKRK